MKLKDKIDSLINIEFSFFPYKFSDLKEVSEHLQKIEGDLPFHIDQIFENQKNADLAKRILGKKSFQHAVAYLLSKHLNDNNYQKFYDHLHLKHDVYCRHLGKDRVLFLKFLLNLKKTIEDEQSNKTMGLMPRAGLLRGDLQ